MNRVLSQKLQAEMQYAKKNASLRFCKMLFLCCFFLGFVIFLLLGKEMLEKIALLDINSLKEIKNSDLEGSSFFFYILWRRAILLGIGILLWWWNFGKLYVYGCFGFSAAAMGSCMYICLMRYRLKGLFLWFFLYFPHMLFYAAVMICGMILSAEVFHIKTEKISFILKNSLWLFLFIAAFIMGVYMESHVNTALLQDYLEFF